MELQDRVQRAMEVLSVEMRAAVWLHYVEGMTYQEVSHVTGIPAGRLRVMSYRARERLRRELADEWQPRVERRQKMVEVKLHDIRVMTRPERPGDLPFLSWVVLLKAVNDDRGMAIWIGPHEGESIAMRMADMAPPRPQTYALTARLIDGLGARIERVSITELVDESFLAVLTLSLRAEKIEFDARPSDALNLALRTDSPMFVDDDLLNRVGFTVGEDVVQSLTARATELRGPPVFDDIEWKSGVVHIKEMAEQRQGQFQRWRAEAEARARARESASESSSC